MLQIGREIAKHSADSSANDRLSVMTGPPWPALPTDPQPPR